MKHKLVKIANILWENSQMNKENLILILNPLTTQEQTQRYLEFLKKNKEELTINQLIRKSLEIAKKI